MMLRNNYRVTESLSKLIYLTINFLRYLHHTFTLQQTIQEVLSDARAGKLFFRFLPFLLRVVLGHGHRIWYTVSQSVSECWFKQKLVIFQPTAACNHGNDQVYIIWPLGQKDTQSALYNIISTSTPSSLFIQMIILFHPWMPMGDFD